MAAAAASCPLAEAAAATILSALLRLPLKHATHIRPGRRSLIVSARRHSSAATAAAAARTYLTMPDRKCHALPSTFCGLLAAT